MSQLQTTKVSTSKVLVPKIEKDEREVKGADWMAAAYPNVFILAMKNSGKSVLAINLLKKKLSKDTKILIFSPTVNMDAAWIKTVEDLEGKGYQVQTYSSFIDEDKVDVLKQFMEDYDSKLESNDVTPLTSKVASTSKSQPVQPVFQTIPGVVWAVRTPIKTTISPKMITEDLQGKPDLRLGTDRNRKPKKPKYVSPEFIVVIDDMGKQMRHKSLVTLMKNNRHYKTMTIMSSQYLTDLFPEQIAQLQYVMLFARIPEDKLEKIFELLAISSVTYEQFSKMYYDATSVKYRFLYVGRHDEEQFRRGMTDKYVIDKVQ